MSESTNTRFPSNLRPSGRSATRNKLHYRFNHWPIWIFVFFIAPGPLTFDLFERGFDRAWLVAGRGAARHRHRGAAREAAGRRAGALHHPVHGRPTEPAVPARLLHVCVERGHYVRRR